MSRKKQVTYKPEVVSSAEPNSRAGLIAVLVISILFVLLSAAYNYLTPPSTLSPTVQHPQDGGASNPDEPAHFAYVTTIADGHLPVFSKADKIDYEAHQPPFYYGLASLIYDCHPSPNYFQNVDRFDHSTDVTFHNVRWAATVLGVALIWISFLTIRQLIPDHQDIAVLTAAIVALTPMNISLSSSVSNDTATNLIFASYLLALLMLLRRPAEYLKFGLLMAGIMMLGIWTKSSTVLLFPLTGIALCIAIWKKTLEVKTAVIVGGVSLGIAVLGSLPWLLRNRALYGDLFAQNVVFHLLATRNVSPQALITAFGENWYITRFFVWTFDSYWGVFDSMLLYLPASVYIVLACISTVTICLGAWTVIKSKKSNIETSTYLIWAVLILLTVVAFVQYNIHFFQLQGRYLYPALLPLSAFSAIGITTIVPTKFRRWTTLAASLALVILNILCLSMISGRYS